MLVECPVCGSRLPPEAAVEVGTGSDLRRYCSARCADEAMQGEGSGGGRLPPAPRRILVAVDGSGPSLRAVELATAIALATGGEILLLCVIDSIWQRGLGVISGAGEALRLGLHADDLERALREDADAQLQRARRTCESAGIAYRTHVEALKLPLEAIVDCAREADLVVMGSRGRGAVSGAILGSLSQRVIGATMTPVLVVH
jgi:nucleotide-binding universal stress UspA family protein